MSHPRFAAWLFLTVVSAGLVAGCSDNDQKVGPSGGVVRVEIQGPASIAPGQSAQYAAIGILSDGTTTALPYSTWASSDSTLVQVTSSGIATAQSRTGEIRPRPSGEHDLRLASGREVRASRAYRKTVQALMIHLATAPNR